MVDCGAPSRPWIAGWITSCLCLLVEYFCVLHCARDLTHDLGRTVCQTLIHGRRYTACQKSACLCVCVPEDAADAVSSWCWRAFLGWRPGSEAGWRTRVKARQLPVATPAPLPPSSGGRLPTCCWLPVTSAPGGKPSSRARCQHTHPRLLICVSVFRPCLDNTFSS